MAWTVNIDEVVPGKGYVIVRATLTDGTEKIRPDEYRVRSEEELKRLLNDTITRLSLSASEFIKIPIGTYDPTPAPPSTLDLARGSYAQDLELYRHLLVAVEFGVKTAADQDVKDQQQKLRDKFLDNYIDLF